MIPPIVVYHAACMGNWQSVVREQMLMLRECGLAQALTDIGDSVRLSHVGKHLEWVLAEAARHDVPMKVIRSDSNTDHYETFAMFEIERLAKEEKVIRPILYFHTKGVTRTKDRMPGAWRQVMEWHTIWKWRENLTVLQTHDAVGFNYWFKGNQHFAGTFWTATADWIRRLPDYAGFHRSKKLERYSCELWIGAPGNCKAMSYVVHDMTCHHNNMDWTPFLPPSDIRIFPPESITWVSAASVTYRNDMNKMIASAKLLGPGHEFRPQIRNERQWHHTTKLEALQQALTDIKTTHLFWIDADCEFMTTLRPRDFIDLNKPLSAVRHLAFGRPKNHIPAQFHARIKYNHDMYYQSCLFGGTVAAMRQLLDGTRWMFGGHDYDEHVLNIYWDSVPQEDIHVLPGRYAYPSSFAKIGHYEAICNERAGGEARVLHHNRNTHR